MNENNQQQHPVTPTHSWGVITETEGGFNGEPVQHAKAKATQYIKSTLAEFGLCTHASAIQLRQETWAKLHEAMSVLMEQPAQHQPQAIHQWRRVDKPELGWFDDTHERAYHADPKMEGRTLYSTPQPAQQQEPVAWDGDCVLGHCGSPAGCEASNCCRADYTTPPQRKPLTDEQEREAFVEWCLSVGLMAESYGIRSESSHCGTAWKAWQARAAHGIKGDA